MRRFRNGTPSGSQQWAATRCEAATIDRLCEEQDMSTLDINTVRAGDEITVRNEVSAEPNGIAPRTPARDFTVGDVVLRIGGGTPIEVLAFDRGAFWGWVADEGHHISGRPDLYELAL
jgi:hypothetical protein